MDKKIKILSISKDDRISIEKINNIEYVDVINNTTPITTLYNKEIEKSQDYDYLIFMHGDVNVDLTHMIPHMIECSSKYDIMGLCGCQKMNTSHSPLNWFTGSSHFPEGRYGYVTHGEDNKGTSFFNYKKPEITDIPELDKEAFDKNKVKSFALSQFYVSNIVQINSLDLIFLNKEDIYPLYH